MNSNRRPEKWKVINGQFAELEMKSKLAKDQDQFDPDDLYGRLARIGALTNDLRGLVDCIDKAGRK